MVTANTVVMHLATLAPSAPAAPPPPLPPDLRSPPIVRGPDGVLYVLPSMRRLPGLARTRALVVVVDTTGEAVA